MTAWGLRRGRAALVQGRGNSPVLVLRQAWPKSRSGVQPVQPGWTGWLAGWLPGGPAGVAGAERLERPAGGNGEPAPRVTSARHAQRRTS